MYDRFVHHYLHLKAKYLALIKNLLLPPPCWFNYCICFAYALSIKCGGIVLWFRSSLPVPVACPDKILQFCAYVAVGAVSQDHHLLCFFPLYSSVIPFLLFSALSEPEADIHNTFKKRSQTVAPLITNFSMGTLIPVWFRLSVPSFFSCEFTSANLRSGVPY